jgi:hypothetical protein
VTDDNAMVLLLAGLGLADGEKYHGLEMEHNIKRGIDFDWGKLPTVSIWHDDDLHVQTHLLVLISSTDGNVFIIFMTGMFLFSGHPKNKQMEDP